MELAELLTYTWNEIKNDAALKLNLAKAYAREMNDSPCCDPVIETYFKNHKNKLKSKKMKHVFPKSENYALKPKIVLFLRSKNTHVTNHNLTDELAELLIEENPKNAANFEKLPTGKIKTKDKKVSESKTTDDDISHLSKKDIYNLLSNLGIDESEYIKLNKEQLIAFYQTKK